MPINVNGTPCTLAGGVRETSNTTGTGDYALNGAATIDGITYRTFAAAIGNGVNTVYRAQLGSEYEHGIGTVVTPSTLTRATILASSNGGNAVNWATTDPKDIWCDAAAAVFHSVQSQIDGNATDIAALQTLTAQITKDGSNQYTFDPGANNRNAIQIANATDAVVAALRVLSGGEGRVQVENSSSAIQAVLSAASGGSVFIGGDESTGRRIAPIFTFGPTATTSGSQFDQAIPAGAREIDLAFNLNSLSSTGSIVVQLGTGSTPQATGYSGGSNGAGASDTINLEITTGMPIVMGSAAGQFRGGMRLMHIGSNNWVSSHSGYFGDTDRGVVGGSAVTLGGECDILRITRTGADTFDGGSFFGTVKF